MGIDSFQVGDRFTLELDMVCSDGNGIKFDKGVFLIVKDANYGDQAVKAEVIEVMSNTVIFKRISKISSAPVDEVYSDGPYDLDEGDEEYDEDEDE